MTLFKLSSFSRLHITFIIQHSTLIDAVVITIIIIMYRRSISISLVFVATFVTFGQCSTLPT